MESTLTATLSVRGLPLHVHLGVTEFERSLPQKVLLHFTFFYPTPPQGCESDAHVDVVCYQNISEHIHCHLEHKTFALIEKLAQETLAVIRQLVPNEVGIIVEVEKLTIDYIEGSVIFKLYSGCNAPIIG